MAMLYLDPQVQGEHLTLSDKLLAQLTEYCQESAYRSEFRRRSHLFVPLIRDDFRAKVGGGEIAADTFIWDLEDSIPVGSKQAARACISKIPPKVGNVEYGVRINAGDSGQADRDVDAVVQYPFDSITLPKGETPEQISRLIRQLGEDKCFAVTIETVRGLQAVDEIASVLRPGKDALGFGVGDMSMELGVERISTCENPWFQQILGMIAISGRRYNLELLDSVSARFNDPECARAEARLSYRCYGYTGKKLINPKQLDAINSVFSPTRAEIAGHLDTMDSFIATNQPNDKSKTKDRSKTNARVVSSEYKGLPAFIAAERRVQRYLRQGYLSLTPYPERAVDTKK